MRMNRISQIDRTIGIGAIGTRGADLAFTKQIFTLVVGTEQPLRATTTDASGVTVLVPVMPFRDLRVGGGQPVSAKGVPRDEGFLVGSPDLAVRGVIDSSRVSLRTFHRIVNPVMPSVGISATLEGTKPTVRGVSDLTTPSTPSSFVTVEV